jgi:hypothetical protein
VVQGGELFGEHDRWGERRVDDGGTEPDRRRQGGDVCEGDEGVVYGSVRRPEVAVGWDREPLEAPQRRVAELIRLLRDVHHVVLGCPAA